MTDRPVASRRRFLAGVAATSMAAVAGCNETSIGGDDGPTRFSSVGNRSNPRAIRPEADRPVPIEPDDDVIGRGIERVDDLLADVPDPVPVETVPNGVVRESIDRRRESATDDRSDALEPRSRATVRSGSPSPGHASPLEGSRNASAVDADPDLDDLAAECDEAQSTVDDRLEGSSTAATIPTTDGSVGRSSPPTARTTWLPLGEPSIAGG
ncbi:hypothetical protein D8S78_12005 [Natrialba swarupiae]|nr:hypothetical protein [Natrialba swarupiae]